MTERVLVYDCLCGMSGDIHIGAMLDLGVPLPLLQQQLSTLAVADEFELQVKRDKKLGISGTKATVVLREGIKRPHRHLADIEKIINSAALTPGANNLATNIFTRIAQAEAKVHDIDIQSVHFHEVGATDSIVDIVAAAIAIDHLDISGAYCCNLELGSGMVRCEHGVMPVPAPATAEILRDVPTRIGGVKGEATTPTGAAILREVVTRFAAPGAFTASAIGYGVGHKDFEVANVARVMLGTTPASGFAAGALETATNMVIEANIDDMSPEAFQPLSERLLQLGALDVFTSSITMKKGRPATKLSVLAQPDIAPLLINHVLSHSTSIGVRTYDVTKQMLPRTRRTITSSYGDVRIKVVTLPDGSSRWKLEHDDVVACAERHGLEYLQARQLLEQAVTSALTPP